MTPERTARMDATFTRDDERLPEEPVAAGAWRNLLFQALAVYALVVGARYLAWRWTSSLNPELIVFAVSVAVAETFAYVADAVFFLSVWRRERVTPAPPPTTAAEVAGSVRPEDDRPLRVDVLIATYGEAVELVRLSVQDSKRLRYPHPLRLKIVVLDDGNRPAMRQMCIEEGVEWLPRATNIGFKAGNLRHGLQHTDGDLVVICDADTRPLPSLLEETLGYFRDPCVAWVQTPQWFYDIDRGARLPDWLGVRVGLGDVGRAVGRGLERLLGPISIGADPLGNDPRVFYDVIQASRNWCNAAFCCGAGSIHRREAVMETALREFSSQVRSATRRVADQVQDPSLRRPLALAVAGEVARRTELTPYRFHVSEDIYTSIVIHADEHHWRSIYHPRVVTRMLSPQDLLAWTIQRFKYASGTLDIALNDNPLRRRGLTPWQKIMYGATICAYLAPLWLVPLLIAPLVFFFAGATPVVAFDTAFFAQIIPFLVAKRLAFMVGTWGVPTWRAEQYYLASSWLHLKALVHAVARRPLRFPVTPKHREARRFVGLVLPQVVLVAAMVTGIVYRGALIATGRAPADVVAYVVNVFWSLYTVTCLLPIIAAGVAPRAARGVEA